MLDQFYVLYKNILENLTFRCQFLKSIIWRNSQKSKVPTLFDSIRANWERPKLAPRSKFEKTTSKGHYFESVIKITMPENTRRVTHETQKPVFPNGIKKLKIFSKFLTFEEMFGENSRIAKKGALRS